MKRWAERARQLKIELVALYLAARHPQTPWPAPVLAECRSRAQARVVAQTKFNWMFIAAIWAALAAAGVAFYI